MGQLLYVSNGDGPDPTSTIHSLVVVLSSFTPLRLNTNSAVCRNFTLVYFNLAYHNCAQSVLFEAKPQQGG